MEFSVFASMPVILKVLLILSFDSSKAIECPTENDNKCESFWHQLLKYPGNKYLFNIMLS